MKIKEIINWILRFTKSQKRVKSTYLETLSILPLPDDIIRYIYTFDNTYRDVFSRLVLPFIHRYIAYTYETPNKNTAYIIIDTEKMFHIITDSLTQPKFITTSFTITSSMYLSKEVKKINIDIKDIEYIKNYKFQVDEILSDKTNMWTIYVVYLTIK